MATKRIVTTWYEVQHRRIETTKGVKEMFVAVNRLLRVDATRKDGTPAMFDTEDEAVDWCKDNSPKVGWR